MKNEIDSSILITSRWFSVNEIYKIQEEAYQQGKADTLKEIEKIKKANYQAFENNGELTQQQIDRYYHRFRLCDELLTKLKSEKKEKESDER
jgi:hypothetical protein